MRPNRLPTRLDWPSSPQRITPIRQPFPWRRHVPGMVFVAVCVALGLGVLLP